MLLDLSASFGLSVGLSVGGRGVVSPSDVALRSLSVSGKHLLVMIQ